jgi:PPOX class probable F420-dependent enzyme
MPRIDLRLSPTEIESFLAEPRTGSLATLDRHGFPHQAAMWYVPLPDAILMWTYRPSQKAVNLRRDRRASFIVEDGDRYLTLRGVMVRCEAELIEDLEQVREIGLALFERYSAEIGGEAMRAAAAAQAPKRTGIRLPLANVVSWDHRRLTRTG